MTTISSHPTHAATRPSFVRLIQFALVGASGVVVNLVAVYLAQSVLGTVSSSLSTALPVDRIALAVGILVSILTNFLLNDAWTWGDKRELTERGVLRRCADYYLTNGLAALVQYAIANLALGPLSGLSFSVAGYALAPHATVIASLIAILVAMPLNFVANHLWTYRSASNASDR